MEPAEAAMKRGPMDFVTSFSSMHKNLQARHVTTILRQIAGFYPDKLNDSNGGVSTSLVIRYDHICDSVSLPIVVNHFLLRILANVALISFNKYLRQK